MWNGGDSITFCDVLSCPVNVTVDTNTSAEEQVSGDCGDCQPCAFSGFRPLRPCKNNCRGGDNISISDTLTCTNGLFHYQLRG